MYTPSILLLFPLLTSASLLPALPQYVFSNPPSPEIFKIPTSYESAILARRILHLTPLGTLSTVFPAPKDAAPLSNTPSDLGGLPIGLMDYISDCESAGNPTILAIKIATQFRNVAAGSNISLSLQWTPPYPPSHRISSDSSKLAYSAANLPRFSLIGYLESIPEEETPGKELSECFVDSHPDAKYWLPGNRIHEAEWMRLVVEKVYWVGGFGDRAYIGWIDKSEWSNVTRKEWEAVRLPGEKKGWKEWAVEVFGGEL